MPDLLALSSDRETQEAARVIGQVLWDDLNFEREFYMIPRDTYKIIPAAATIDAVPYDRWRELGADGVVIGTVQKAATGIRVEMRLYNVRARPVGLRPRIHRLGGQPAALCAHHGRRAARVAAQLRGVARTKLTFVSDRNREAVVATVEKRDVKEIYVADYDGANPRRITINRTMNLSPNWSPDGRSIAYTSYRTGVPDILISNIYAGTMESPTKGVGQNWLPVFSPDGTRIAFISNRDGNSEIYVMNRDGSNLTPADQQPEPSTRRRRGRRPARRSRSRPSARGTPQIYVIGADGSGLAAGSRPSRTPIAPTWSPAPYNEIAFAARTGPGFDIKILNIGTGETRQITFGEGSNESPAWAPNGRHLAFMSTRAGRSQIFTVDRDGKNLRQITRDGNNTTPNWSQ